MATTARRTSRELDHPAGTAALWCLVLSPALLLPGGLDRFVLVKVLGVAVAVLLAVWATPTGSLPRWAVVGLAVGAAWLVVAALTADAPWAQLWGRWPRYEGLLVLPAYAGALWAGARLLGPALHPAGARTLVRAVTVLTALVGGVAVVEALGGTVLSSNVDRAGSLLGNATEQGIVGLLAVAVLLPAVVLTDVDGRRAPVDGVPVRAAALALAAVTVVLSGSRGALVGLLVAVTVGGAILALPPVRAALATSAGRKESKRAAAAHRLLVRTGVVAGVLGGGVVATALVVPSMSQRLTGASPLSGDTVAGRWQLWSESLRLIRDHPLLGAGPSGFVEAIPTYHTLEWAQLVGPQNPPDSPHAWPLQIAAAGGIPVLVLAVVLAVLGLVAGARALGWPPVGRVESPAGGRGRTATHGHGGRDRTLVLVAGVSGLAGYAVAAATHFTSAGTTPLAAALAGAVVATAVRPVRGRLRRVARWLGVGGVALWLAVLLPAVAAEWPLAAAYQAISAGSVGPGGDADRAFTTAQRLRPWDGDIAVLAAHAFATVALAGGSQAGPAAETWADTATDRVPSSALALAARSAAAEVNGDLDAAEEDMTLLVEREPVNPDWLLRRGVIRASADDGAGAEADFLRAAELAPDSPVPWQNLEVLYDAAGDDDAARAAAAEAARRTG